MILTGVGFVREDNLWCYGQDRLLIFGDALVDQLRPQDLEAVAHELVRVHQDALQGIPVSPEVLEIVGQIVAAAVPEMAKGSGGHPEKISERVNVLFREVVKEFEKIRP